MSLNPVFLAAVVLVAAEPARPDRRFDAKAVEFFEKKVRPVLVRQLLQLPLRQHQCQGRTARRRPQRPAPGGQQRAGRRPRRSRRRAC